MAPVGHLEGFAVIAGPLTDIALNIDIRQEIHLDHIDALAAARLTATALDVETELAHLIAPGLGLHRGRKHLANRIKGSGVGGGVGAGGAPDRRLVDHDHLVDRLDAAQLPQAGREGHLHTQLVLQRRMQQLVHQGALAATAHAGDAHQPAQGDLHIEAREVVALAVHQADPAAAAGAALGRGGNGATTAEVGAGEGVFGRQQVGQAALSHDVAAMHAGPRTDVHQVVCGANGVFVVLHHDQGVAQIPQLQQGVEQAVVVALVQADARLIQHVEHAGQAGTDLGGQPDALGLAATEGHGRPIQAEVIEAHIQQEFEPQPDLPQHQVADLDLARRQQGLGPFAFAHPHQRFNPPQGFAHAHGSEFVDGVGAHPHRQGFRPQPQPMTGGAWNQLQELLQLLAHRFTAGIGQLALQDRQDPLEGPLKAGALAIAAIGLDQDRLPAAIEQHIALLVAELVPGRFDLKFERLTH